MLKFGIKLKKIISRISLIVILICKIQNLGSVSIPNEIHIVDFQFGSQFDHSNKANQIITKAIKKTLTLF